MEVKLDFVKRSGNGETATNIGHLLDLSDSTVASNMYICENIFRFPVIDTDIYLLNYDLAISR